MFLSSLDVFVFPKWIMLMMNYNIDQKVINFDFSSSLHRLLSVTVAICVESFSNNLIIVI